MIMIKENIALLLPPKIIFVFHDEAQYKLFINELSKYIKTSSYYSFPFNPQNRFIYGQFISDEFYMYESDLGCRDALISEDYILVEGLSKSFKMIIACSALEVEKDE